MSHFINLYREYNNVISILEIHFTYISCCYIQQTADKLNADNLSGCQEQPLLIRGSFTQRCDHGISEMWLSRGSYGVYVVVTGSSSSTFSRKSPCVAIKGHMYVRV